METVRQGPEFSEGDPVTPVDGSGILGKITKVHSPRDDDGEFTYDTEWEDGDRTYREPADAFAEHWTRGL